MSMTQTQQHNVPSLRFPEFSGEWSKVTLGKTAIKISDGIHSTPNYSPSGEYYFVNGNNISNGNILFSATTKKIDATEAEKHRKDLNENTILLSINGTIGSLAFYRGEKIVLGKSACYFNVTDTCSRGFIFQLLNTRTIKKEFFSGLTGTTIKNLGIRTIKDTKANISTLPEQQKIASFLSSVDGKIEQLGKKKSLLEQYKKGMMQKLFSQELRFKDAQGNDFPDWKEKRLGEISTSNDSGIYKKKELYGQGHNIVGVSDLFKMDSIDGQEFRRVPLSQKEIEGNSLRAGDILYAESSLVRKGIAKSVYVTKKGAGTAFAWHTRRFSIDSQVANSAYVYYFLESDFARRYIESVATQTALTGMTTKDYFKTPLLLPCQAEQVKIANIFLSIDRKISLASTELDHAKTFKKGLLQQMFI